MYLVITLLFGLFSSNVSAQQSCEQTSILSTELSNHISQINDAVYADLYSCLEKLSADPLVSENYQTDFWQTIGGKKTFMFRCWGADAQFLMVNNKGIESLDYPTYTYQHKFSNGSTETVKLPSDFMRFYQEGKEYILFEFYDQVKLIPRAKLAQFAKEEMTTVAKIENDKFKKYETYLKQEKGISQITPRKLNAEELPATTACFERILPTYVSQMIDAEARKLIPYSSSYGPDLQKIYTLSNEELKASELAGRYKFTVAEIKKSVTDYFLGRLDGKCSTQFDAGILDKLLEKAYKNDLENYAKVQGVVSRKIN